MESAVQRAPSRKASAPVILVLVLPALRHAFNTRFRPEDYRRLLDHLSDVTHTRIGFRVAETPIFLPVDLLSSMAHIGIEITHSLLSNPDYLAASAAVIPERSRIPGETPHPHFMTADFGLVRSADGSMKPMLVELQAFPSIHAFVSLLAEAYRDTYNLDPSLRCFLGGHTESTFSGTLTQIILNNHDPENVVLLEIDPERQKTLADFRLTAGRLGIRILDVRNLIPDNHSHRLFYRNGHRLVPIHRIYNRIVPEELASKIAQNQLQLPFDLREPFNVEWIGHPNWYYRLSKFALPWLRHPSVPPAVFLDQWLNGSGHDLLPDDLSNLVLKPLFSFGGQDIRFHPALSDLKSIPPTQRPGYLLQKKMDFLRCIETPCGPTQPEIRILYLWPDSGQISPVLTLVRMGRKAMMGITQNQALDWAGASVAFFPAAQHP